MVDLDSGPFKFCTLYLYTCKTTCWHPNIQMNHVILQGSNGPGTERTGNQLERWNWNCSFAKLDT